MSPGVVSVRAEGRGENNNVLWRWSKTGMRHEDEDGALPLYLWRLPWGRRDEGVCLTTQHPGARNCQERETGIQQEDRQR